jgi:hypothetical protein
MNGEEQLEQQVYLTHKYVCKINDKTPFISHWRKSRVLIIVTKNGEMAQIPMSLNCQNQRKEKEIKVCDWNYLKIGGHTYLPV